MSKNTKHVVLFNLLKSGEVCHIDTIVDTLQCQLVTAMGYIFTLRNKFGADIVTVRNGRKTEYYQLRNADQVAARFGKVSQPTAEISTDTEDSNNVTSDSVDDDFDLYCDDHMTTLDLRSELGLTESYRE